MDYVTRQFINLTKRLLRETRKAFTSLGVDLHHIKDAIQSIDKNAHANQQKEQPKIEVVALVHEPEGAEAKRRAEYDRTQRRDRVRLLVEWLTFFAVVFYGYMAVRQWREQISARRQAQSAVEAAVRAANAAETANTNAKEQFRADERPYIAIAPAGDTTKIWIVASGEHKGHLAVEIHISNYGKSPAIEIGRDARIAVGSAAAKQIRLHRATDRLVRITPPGSKPSVFAYSDDIVDQQIFNDISAGKVLVVIYGHIDYTDMLGQPRIQYLSEFCGQILGSPDYAQETNAACENHVNMN
jgi:Flp pilus assembly protein TadG